MKRTYQICSRCVVDTSVPDVNFDENGHCNYCTRYLDRFSTMGNDEAKLTNERRALIDQIRSAGKGRKYDCIVGVSGGVDSSYALYLAVRSGLRPLAVHLDNGWNSEFAQRNIENLVRRLNVDLFTHVIDWEENRLLQLSFFDAGVIDIEMIMDNAQACLSYSMARKYRLNHILSGVNTRTEGMPIPEGWYHYKFDVRNIRAINAAHRRVKIATHPLMGTLQWMIYDRVFRVRYHKFLDYVIYNKTNAIRELQAEVGYIPYRYKHSESIFTRFYQNYILPVRFGVDKRRIHHSNQICTGEISREEALCDLQKNNYIDSGEARADREYVIKKLGMTEAEFVSYMNRDRVDHIHYGSELRMVKSITKLIRQFKTLLGK